MGELVGFLPGGPAGNFACAASRFSPRVGILAAVGSDEAGALIVSEFQRYGVDTSRIRVIEGAKSNFTVSLVDPTGEKAIVVVPMLADAYVLDDSGQEPPRARLLFGMPDPHGHFFAVARPARKCGAQVMIDIELTTLSELPDPVALLPEADIVSFNRDSFIAVTGDLPAIAAARAPRARAAHDHRDPGRRRRIGGHPGRSGRMPGLPGHGRRQHRRQRHLQRGLRQRHARRPAPGRAPPLRQRRRRDRGNRQRAARPFTRHGGGRGVQTRTRVMIWNPDKVAGPVTKSLESSPLSQHTGRGAGGEGRPRQCGGHYQDFV
jgi:hypothetical protein